MGNIPGHTCIHIKEAAEIQLPLFVFGNVNYCPSIYPHRSVISNLCLLQRFGYKDIDTKHGEYIGNKK